MVVGLAEWGYGMYMKAAPLVFPDRSSSAEGQAKFIKVGMLEDEKYWKGREDTTWGS